jgi:hypothetical protein
MRLPPRLCLFFFRVFFYRSLYATTFHSFCDSEIDDEIMAAMGEGLMHNEGLTHLK